MQYAYAGPTVSARHAHPTALLAAAPPVSSVPVEHHVHAVCCPGERSRPLEGKGCAVEPVMGGGEEGSPGDGRGWRLGGPSWEAACHLRSGS